MLIGCSSSQDEPKAEKPPELKEISLQLLWVTQAQFAGYYVALEKGWYRQEGLDVHIYPGGPDVIPVDLVAAGTRDFGTSFLADLAVAIEKGIPVISIGQIQQDSGLRLITKKDAGILGPKDFINKKVGVWLGSWEAQFNALMAQQGIGLDKLDVISQGWSMQPFLEDRLDVASAMIYNEYHKVLETGIKPSDLVVIDYADYGLDFPGDVLMTSVKLVKENPDLCTRMVRASLRGWRYALDHQTAAVDIVLKYDSAKVQSRDHQLNMMMEISKLIKAQNINIGQIEPARLNHMISHLRKYGVLKSELNPDRIYTDRFIKPVALKAKQE